MPPPPSNAGQAILLRWPPRTQRLCHPVATDRGAEGSQRQRASCTNRPRGGAKNSGNHFHAPREIWFEEGRDPSRANIPKRSSLLKTARPFCDVPQRRREGEVVFGGTRLQVLMSLALRREVKPTRNSEGPVRKPAFRTKHRVGFKRCNSPPLSLPSHSHRSPYTLRSSSQPDSRNKAQRSTVPT
jgi:hypothetical protein